MLESVQRKGEIMPLKLPAPVAAYIAVENGDDVAALAQCFAENAVVQDEGRTMKGLAAIQRWKTETKRKYQHTVEPLASVRKDGKTIVRTRLTGEFPGSPVELQFVFGLEGDRISSLEIRQ
jgi:SnoaL-like protein